jgi:hypothetical protein
MECYRHALGFISGERAETMNKIVTVAIVAAGIVAAGIGLAPIAAGAQERAGDAALGALSGALVGGPIGLVAGGVVGFTAGPSIARSWGLRNRHYRARRTASRH